MTQRNFICAHSIRCPAHRTKWSDEAALSTDDELGGVWPVTSQPVSNEHSSSSSSSNNNSNNNINNVEWRGDGRKRPGEVAGSGGSSSCVCVCARI
jgi:hypothetical protein